MDPNTPNPGKGHLHDVTKPGTPGSARRHICLSPTGLKASHFPSPYGDEKQFAHLLSPPHKPWEQEFWDLSYTLFEELSSQNGLVVKLNDAYASWMIENPHGTLADFLAEPDTVKDLDKYHKVIDRIRDRLRKTDPAFPDLAWPPITSFDLPGTAKPKVAAPAEAGYISNNGADIPGVDPITFDVKAPSGLYLGRAYIVFTQDCEWLTPPATGKLPAGDDWLSWGIVTSFSVRFVANELTPSFSSSSCRYSTSSQLPP
jgi:hypothetical protein